MKKLICLLLTLVVLLSCFCSCKPESKEVTLTLLVEESFLNVAEKELVELVDYLYPEITLEFTTLPVDGTKRDAALQNIRTEIMAGSGPDIFILSTWNQQMLTWGAAIFDEIPRVEPVFKSIDDAMNNGVFLNLDKYIEKSEFIDLEDHVEIIMKAGRNEYGQMVMPIHYSVPLFLADKEYLPGIDELMLNSEFLSNTDNIPLLYTLQGWFMEEWFSYLFTDYEDDNNNLILSIEDMKAAFDFAEAAFEAPEGNESCVIYKLQNDFYSLNFNESMLYRLHNNKEDVVPVFLENTDGGVTAFIESYAAINNSTDHPEEAFKILELLFREETQSSAGITAELQSGVQRKLGLTIMPFVFSKDSGIFTSKAAFSDSVMFDYSDVEYINSKITHVRFVSEYDALLTDAWKELETTYYRTSWKNSLNYDAMAEELYSELYSDFKMIAAE